MKRRTVKWNRNVVPDRLDLRDRPYQPTVRQAPPGALNTLAKIRQSVRNQDDTSACTGFALAATIDILLKRAGRQSEANVSPFMLYDMARRYDEFPGYKADDGSSVRGALKAWYRHGACAAKLWDCMDMPPAKTDPTQDWWQDAARRPLGAYYRVDSRSVTDIQVALWEVGVVYASVVCHSGWEEDDDITTKTWVIPRRRVRPSDGGHAIALVGYDSRGFQVLNSWGADWGVRGTAILTYEDWLANAMDCWVAQLGVPTEQHKEVAAAVSLRTSEKKVKLASDITLRNREISPFIVNVENNGKLSSSGTFRTLPPDLNALATIHLNAAIDLWKPRPGQPIDIAIYAHGGLVGEESAADTAARWIPALYDAKLFPVFIMWESDILSTLRNRLADILDTAPTEVERRTSGVKDQWLQRWWNKRLERTFAKPGSFCWGEMKQNAQALSEEAGSGMRRLFAEFKAAQPALKRPVRFHLIGHSAGAIVHTYMAEQLIAANEPIESLVFLAPAVTNHEFVKRVKPHIGKRIGRFATYLLDDTTEQSDPSCKALLLYGRSLLYLVSESFETEKRQMPILGMETFFKAAATGIKPLKLVVAPGADSRSTTHGGFDDDATTMASVINFLKQH